MTDYRKIEQQLLRNFGSVSDVPGACGKEQGRPVAVKFQGTPPPGVSQFIGSEPSGCSYWRIAAAGRTFYTVPKDHYNCAIGSYTHNIPLPPERASELDQTLSFMTSLGYVRMEEISRIPRLSQTPGVVIYAPLGDTPVDPDVVVLAGTPGRVMFLQEAALRTGLNAQVSLMGRPTCMALPAAFARGVIVSTACIGNRVYTDLGENELYIVVPGRYISRIAEESAVIVSANAQLSAYHLDRRKELATE